MSQLYIQSTGGGGGGSGDVNGPSSSVTGDVVVFGDTTGKLIADSGISINDFVISLTGTQTTAGDETKTILTVALGATPTTVTISGTISSYESTTPASAGYTILATFRTNGTVATFVGANSPIFIEDSALATADVIGSVSGNNGLIQVKGVTGLNISWSCEAFRTSV